MNSVVEQMIRCLLSDHSWKSHWKEVLPTAELAINSIPNRSTGYSPFFLMYGYNPVLLVELIKGDKIVSNEMVLTFVKRMKMIWPKAQTQLKKTIRMQAKYCNRKHRDVRYAVGDFVLLST